MSSLPGRALVLNLGGLLNVIDNYHLQCEGEWRLLSVKRHLSPSLVWPGSREWTHPRTCVGLKVGLRAQRLIHLLASL